jgi:hypothetical protein
LAPTLISCLFHNRSLGHCRDKIEFNLKSQKLEEPPLFERRRFRGGARNVDICFCGSTRILNFLQLSRRLLSATVAFCSPSLWRGAETSKGVRGDKGNLQKCFEGQRKCPAITRPAKGACWPRMAAGTRFAGGDSSGYRKYSTRGIRPEKSLGRVDHFPDVFEESSQERARRAMIDRLRRPMIRGFAVTRPWIADSATAAAPQCIQALIARERPWAKDSRADARFGSASQRHPPLRLPSTKAAW